MLYVLRPEGVEGSEEGRDSEMICGRVLCLEAVEKLEKKQKGFRDVILV